MGFFSNAIFGFVAGICAIFGLRFCQKKRSHARMQRAVDLASLSRAKAEDFRKLFSKEFFPTWVQFPEYERVHWLNTQIKEIWPYVNKAASVLLRESLEPVLQDYRPTGIKALTFQKLTLGTIAPQFGGVKIVESPQNEIVMEIDFKWGGNPIVILMVESMLQVSLPVQVRDVSFFGVFRIALTPLVDTIPCFGAITVALSQKPSLNFSLDIIGGEVTMIPGLSSTIDGLLRTAVTDSLLWPMRQVIPIVPGDYRYLELRPVGDLEVKLVEARDLIADLVIGKPDAFAILNVRELPSRVKKSRTKRSTANPVWNEVFSLVVEDLATQRLTITVMHETELSASRPIGRTAMDLAGLQPGRLKSEWLDLVKDVDNPKADPRKLGSVHLEVTYNPRIDSSGSTVLERELTNLQAVPQRLKGRNQRGVLMVTVDKGEDLVPRGISNTTDAYVLLSTQLGSARKRTKVIPKSLNPIWNETFDFLVEDADHDMLNFEVFDHDMFGKQLIGRSSITLTQVIYDGDHEEVLELRDVEKGKLVVFLRWKALA